VLIEWVCLTTHATTFAAALARACHCFFVCCRAADLINVFEVFLPQLLLYPNPTDPLNGEAAALLMREPAKYNTRVKGEGRHA
jgi:hypothetical protein